MGFIVCGLNGLWKVIGCILIGILWINLLWIGLGISLVFVW